MVGSVHFRLDTQRRFIQGHGEQVLVFPCLQCSCLLADRQFDPNCSGCKGTGRFYPPGTAYSTMLLMVQEHSRRTYNDPGTWMPGTIQASILPGIRLAERDKIRRLDITETFTDEVLTRGLDDTVRFGGGVTFDLVADRERIYRPDVDYAASSGNPTLTWLASGQTPAFMAQYSVKYSAQPDYLVTPDNPRSRVEHRVPQAQVVTLTRLDYLAEGLGMAETRFPHLVQAMQQAAQYVQSRWMAMADQTLTTPGEREAYAAGFSAEPPPVEQTANGLRTVVSNTAPAARRIEDGTPAFHLPERVNWAQAKGARRSKGGRFYLVIPFRHYSAQRGSRKAAGSAVASRNMLARPVYNVAQRLSRGQYLTVGPSGGRAVHAPGLRPYVPAFAPNVRPGHTHAAREEGLIRSTGARKGTSTYLTFRTMTSDSPGWWIPAKPARPIAARVARETAPEVRRILEAAAGADVIAQVHVAVEGGARAG